MNDALPLSAHLIQPLSVYRLVGNVFKCSPFGVVIHGLHMVQNLVGRLYCIHQIDALHVADAMVVLSGPTPVPLTWDASEARLPLPEQASTPASAE